MVSPPAARREGEGIEGSAWREPHHTSSAPYGAEFSFSLSPRPYSGGISSRGPPPPYHYDYYGSSSNNDGPPPPPHRGPPPGNEYWMSPPPPPPNRGPPPGNEYWMSPPPYQHMPHPSQQQHQHRSPSRRGPPYGGPGDHHLFQQKQHGHQRKDFSPPAPAAPVGQSPTTRGVQVTVSASADSEESLRPSLKQDGGRGRSNDAGDNHDDDDNDNDNDVIMGNESESVSKQGKKEKGDPLSVLADVSAGMGGKNKQGKQKDAADNSKKSDPDSASEENATSTSTTNAATASRPPPVPMPAPTSPLQRRMKPSPITPSQTPQENSINSSTKRTPPTGRQHQPITPSRSHESSSTAEGGGGSSQQSLVPPSWEPPPLPHGDSGSGNVSGGSGELYSTHHPEYTSTPQQGGGSSGGVGGGLYNTPSRRGNININSRPGGMRYGGGVSDFGPPFPTDSPALVERGSFDSHGDASSYHRGQGTPLYPPATPTSSRGGAYSFYDEHPPPPPGYGNSPSGGAGYWDSGPPPPPYSPTYPPPNRGGGGWNQSHPPSTHSDPYYGGPAPPHHLHHGPPPDYPYPPPPPPSHYGGPEDHHDPAMYPPPPQHGSLYHHHHHHRGGPPPSMLGGPHHHPGMPPMHSPHHMGGPPPSYPYGHPARMMEEKTILRKKFSWKHYPEVRTIITLSIFYLFTTNTSK
jgi:hypothetical protein